MFTVLFTAEPSPGANGEEDKVAAILGSHEFKGCTIRIERGDYAGIMSKVVENLEKAKVCIVHVQTKLLLRQNRRFFIGDFWASK